ncbi:MAG: transcriptional regulator, partial [Alphaproteobacteria bacterium]|nr:transcriptional regulator [Alphaproteobacteria bacterium]
MRDSEKQIVRALPLFSGMVEANFEAMLAGSFLQRFPASVVLFSE